MKNECLCSRCQSACRRKPGWFKPGEVERVAEYLDISVQKLFETKLGVDWFEGDYTNTFVLAPATIEMKPGTEYPGEPGGQCVFFDEGTGECGIHPVKPYECAQYHHNEAPASSQRRHKEVAEEWAAYDAQQQIEDLLGREPESEEYDGFGGLLGGMWI